MLLLDLLRYYVKMKRKWKEPKRARFSLLRDSNVDTTQNQIFPEKDEKKKTFTKNPECFQFFVETLYKQNGNQCLFSNLFEHFLKYSGATTKLINHVRLRNSRKYNFFSQSTNPSSGKQVEGLPPVQNNSGAVGVLHEGLRPAPIYSLDLRKMRTEEQTDWTSAERFQ